MSTRITISAGFQNGGMLGAKTGPKVEAEVMSDKEESAAVLGDLISAAQFSAEALVGALGVAPYEAPAVVAIDKAETTTPDILRHAAGVDEEDPDEESSTVLIANDRHAAAVADDTWREEQRLAMHKAITDQAPNLRDYAAELDTAAGNAAPTEERSRVLAHALVVAAETLEESRAVEVPE